MIVTVCVCVYTHSLTHTHINQGSHQTNKKEDYHTLKHCLYIFFINIETTKKLLLKNYIYVCIHVCVNTHMRKSQKVLYQEGSRAVKCTWSAENFSVLKYFL